VGNRHYWLTGGCNNDIFAMNYSRPSRASWSLAIAPSMQPQTFSFFPKNGRACTYLPLSRCSSLHHTPGNQVFPRLKDGPPLIISCKNSKNSGGDSKRGAMEHFCLTLRCGTLRRGPNLNLKAKFCCRFVAGTAIGDSPFNRLLRQLQPRAPTGWPSIAVTVMVVRYRGRRRAAA
jgi:hypothetical protein